MLNIIPNWHPLIVHFTLALLTVGSLAMLACLWLKSEPVATQIRALAHWNLWLGGIFAVLAGISGLYAYNSVRHDTVSHLAMQDHRAWAIATIVVFAIVIALTLRSRRAMLRPSPLVAVLCVLGVGLLMSTGWRGGELVYRHGLGVMSLPNPVKHDHAAGDQHDHATPATMPAQSEVSAPHDEHAHDHDAGDDHPEQAGRKASPPSEESSSTESTHVHPDGKSHEH